METWKEKIAKWFSQIFDWLGIDHTTGFGILALPFVIWHLNEIKNRKEEPKISDRFYDAFFFILVFGGYTIFILNLLGVFN